MRGAGFGRYRGGVNRDIYGVLNRRNGGYSGASLFENVFLGVCTVTVFHVLLAER